MTQPAKEKSRYIRVSPTVLHRVPDCYGGKGRPDLLSDACTHCYFRKHCRERQEVVLR